MTRLLQIATTVGDDCGIGNFALSLHRFLSASLEEIETTREFNSKLDNFDVILLHHHPELFSDAAIVDLCESTETPVLLFCHAANTERLFDVVAGTVALTPELIDPRAGRGFFFPTPAFVPGTLEDRDLLRQEFGLPLNRIIIGSSGFLKFERQFAELSERLLSSPKCHEFFIDLLISPWRLPSPGLLETLANLKTRFPDSFRFTFEFLDEETLNRRLQACDLLWCWTSAPSEPYSSGVATDHYGSGTRMLVVDKVQHQRILSLPNVKGAPADLANFVDSILREIAAPDIAKRHDPSPVSWERCAAGLVDFCKALR